jgi:hypothetical protein
MAAMSEEAQQKDNPKKKKKKGTGRRRGEGASTHLERTKERFVHVHHGASVIKLAAVVRRRENCHELTIREELITILYDLYGRQGKR